MKHAGNFFPEVEKYDEFSRQGVCLVSFIMLDVTGFLARNDVHYFPSGHALIFESLKSALMSTWLRFEISIILHVLLKLCYATG